MTLTKPFPLLYQPLGMTQLGVSFLRIISPTLTPLFSSYGNYTFKTLVQRFAKYCSHFTMIQQFMPKMYYIGYILPIKVHMRKRYNIPYFKDCTTPFVY
jgi:hypothetical protein